MLKIWIDDSEDIKKVSESLKQEPEFILDNKRDIGENDESPINLYYVKIGEYYLSDTEYIDTLAADESGYMTVLTEITITRNTDIIIHVEDWELEHIKQGLKSETKIFKIEEKENE